MSVASDLPSCLDAAVAIVVDGTPAFHGDVADALWGLGLVPADHHYTLGLDVLERTVLLPTRDGRSPRPMQARWWCPKGDCTFIRVHNKGGGSACPLCAS